MDVTVYITTYNRLTLLKRAIQSVQEQTYPNIEIIVADDGSDDGTQEYLRDMQEQGVLTAVLNQSGKSKGACFGRNKAIELASGEFITGLDDDDYFEPWRLQKFIENWQLRSNAGDEFAALFDSVVEHRKYGTVYCCDTPIVTYQALRIVNPIGNQVFTLTSRLRQINGFDEEMPALQDWDTWLRLSKDFGDIYNIQTRSYIINHNHGGGRISEKPAAKIRFAFDRLMHKLSPVSKKEQASLINAMYSYEQMNNQISEIFMLFINGYFRRIAQIINRTYFK